MLTRNLNDRLKPFLERGLIDTVPTEWQLLQGSLEMAPYVVTPDAGDDARYDGAPLGHPLLRTPIVLSQIGLDHLQIGHGLFVQAAESYFKHLMFVYHEGMPTYDLQLVQTVPDGLARLRAYVEAIELGTTPAARRQRKLIDLIIPRASRYRQQFLARGGWIDRAAAFDYPSTDELPPYLRPEFTTLVGFLAYCSTAYPATRRDLPVGQVPTHLARLVTRRFRRAA